MTWAGDGRMGMRNGVKNMTGSVPMRICKNVSEKLTCMFSSLHWINHKNINFRTMACSLKPSRVAPVGDAFAQYKKNYGEEEWMKLFMKAEDDHHSSVKGSYLAACVHYRGVRHNSYHQHFYFIPKMRNFYLKWASTILIHTEIKNQEP